VEFCLYITDLKLLEDLGGLFQPLDWQDMPAALKSTVFDNPNAADYIGHLIAVERLASLGLDETAVTRLYFGQEFCEHLVPEPKGVMQALFIARQMGWDFTYVTGNAVDSTLERIAANIEALVAAHGDADSFEVVINDWGVLRRLRQEYPAIKPVLGRLLTKQKRLGRFPEHMPTPNMEEIDTDTDTILRNQMRAWQALNLTVRSWRRFLHRQGIERIDLDMVPQGADLMPDAWGFAFGAYYPWSYLTAARNCPTAGLVDPVRRHVPLDAPCPRPCRRGNANLANMAHDPAPIIQRGTVAVTLNDAFAQPYLTGGVPLDRLVFEPFVPL